MRDEIEIADDDIVCEEPAEGGRPLVRVRYDGASSFLGEYLALRRGEPMVVELPAGIEAGDLIDVEVAIDDREELVLHGEVQGRWPCDDSPWGQVQIVVSRLIDRVVGRLASSGGALGAQMLKTN
jgi:hypothetical protein